MKKIIIACFLTLSLTAFGQIKISDTGKEEIIGEFKTLGKSYAEISKAGTIYFFKYRDEKFVQLDEYKMFHFDEKDSDAIYILFTDFSKVEKGDSKTVDLENGDKLIFDYKKMLGSMYAEVTHISKAGVVGKIRYLTEKQVKKLFGKS